MKRFSIFFLVIIVLIILACGCWYLYWPTPPSFPHRLQPILIAHAGGGIDKHTYTNSREAVEQALQQGFSFIELDLSITPKDRKIVAVHDFKTLLQQTGMELEEGDISYASIKDSKIYGKYTLISADDINRLFSKNSAAWLVTDKIGELDVLLEQIDMPRERMLVEVFSYKAYKTALKNGIRYPMLCVWDIDSLRKLDLLFFMNKIKMITIPIDLLEIAPAEIENLYASGVTIFAFTSNDLDFIKEHINKRVTGFYTDTVLPRQVF